jgi:hypothetical protein
MSRIGRCALLLVQVTAILGRKMETHNEVYLNNLLSIPLVCCLIFAFGEHRNIQVRPCAHAWSLRTVRSSQVTMIRRRDALP